MEQYIEEIRASGISETGRSQIRSVASICVGGTILRYRRDEASGRYWPSYTSATCPKPNTDTPEISRWKKLMVSETDRLVAGLKSFADTDQSGFVTTAEASEFRALIEFGFLADQVFREEAANLELLSRASGRGPDEVADRLVAYQNLVRRITDSGVTGLPYPDLNTAAKGSE